MEYPEFIAECVGAKDTRSLNFVLIQGEKGYIHVENGANGCRQIILHIGESEIILNSQTSMNNLYYEMVVFKEIFKTKDFNQCYKLLDYSRSVMEILVNARKNANIVFDADEM
jgi:scyllo-inositol 2-dehydrogenase (NADP+)